MEKADLTGEDRRLIEKKLKRHEISLSEYQKHLKNLPDDEDKSEELVVYKE